MDEKTVIKVETRAAPFIRSALSESDGTISSTRCMIVLVIVFTIGVVAALLWKIKGPITVADFSQAIGSLGLFAGGICGSLYGINRISEAVETRADDGPKQ